MSPEHFDVVVVGGGVSGCAIADRLSTTTAHVCLLEAEADVAEGASKGNAGVAVSYYGRPGTLETSLITRSNPGWEELCRQLDVPYARIGALMIATSDPEQEALPAILSEIRDCGVRADLLTVDQARAIEPSINPRCRGAVHMPDEGIIDPMRLTVGLARRASMNGCDVRRGCRVTRIERRGELTTVSTNRGSISASFVVNATGVHAGEVSALAGGEELEMWPRKGQYAVLDRDFGSRLRSIVFSVHLPDTKGVNVVPTTHGSCLIGPTAADHSDANDRDTDASTIDDLFDRARRLVPTVDRANAVKFFAANRPASIEPVRVQADTTAPWLIHVVNRSTGVSCAPAAADRVRTLLTDAGLETRDRDRSVESMPVVPRLRTAKSPESLTEIDAGYGQVVCVCEQISAAEIAAALTEPVGARSVDAVRKRTGVTYGRCQGSMCMAGVTFLTAMAVGAGVTDAPLTARGSVSP